MTVSPFLSRHSMRHIKRIPHSISVHQHFWFSSKKKKLPKKWKPTTTMFVPSKEPGKYVLSKSHNLKYEYDPNDGEAAVQETDEDGSPSLIQQIEAAMEDDVDPEESEDVTFMKNYRWIIVSLFGMVILLMGGFTQGFTRIKAGQLLHDDDDDDELKEGSESSNNSNSEGMESENNKNNKKDENDENQSSFRSVFWDFLSRFKADESLVEQRHRAIAQILLDLERNGRDCILIDENERFNNKTDRDNRYLDLVAEGQMTDDKETFERRLVDRVLDKQWPHIELSEFGVDDIGNEHWNMASYIENYNRDDIRLKFVPPLDTMRYGQAKEKKLMWIYSNKYLEWFPIVMTFNDSKQRVENLNFVAIRLRFKEFYCYPFLNEDGTSNTSQWLIEKKKYEPRVEHLRRIQRHRAYYYKKYWLKVDPAKYELDVDDEIIDYYGRDIFNEKESESGGDEEEKAKSGMIAKTDEETAKDEELIKMVNALEARLERRRKLQEAEQARNNKHE